MQTQIQIEESIRESVGTSAIGDVGHYKLKKREWWFDEEGSELLDKRKWMKMQWLQSKSELSGDNVDNARRESHRTCRIKEREHI